MSDADVVRSLFRCYLDQDRPGAEALVAPAFRFTSPVDDHIDRAAWFDRCFPTADRLAHQELREVVEVGEGVVLVRYDYVLRTGEPHRNMEALTVADGRVVDAEVYFGGRVDPAAGPAQSQR